MLGPQELWEEGKEEYLHSGWNVMDCSMATCYLLYYILKVRAQQAYDQPKCLLMHMLQGSRWAWSC